MLNKKLLSKTLMVTSALAMNMIPTYEAQAADCNYGAGSTATEAGALVCNNLNITLDASPTFQNTVAASSKSTISGTSTPTFESTFNTKDFDVYGSSTSVFKGNSTITGGYSWIYGNATATFEGNVDANFLYFYDNAKSTFKGPVNVTQELYTDINSNTVFEGPVTASYSSLWGSSIVTFKDAATFDANLDVVGNAAATFESSLNADTIDTKNSAVATFKGKVTLNENLQTFGTSKATFESDVIIAEVIDTRDSSEAIFTSTSKITTPFIFISGTSKPQFLGALQTGTKVEIYDTSVPIVGGLNIAPDSIKFKGVYVFGGFADSSLKTSANVATKISAPITTTIANQGNLFVQGDATFEAAVGTEALPLKLIDFTSKDSKHIATINSDMVAERININASQIQAGTATVIHSTGNSTTHLIGNNTFTLSSKDITFKGNVAHDATSGNVTVNTNYNGANIGKISQNSGSFDLKTNVSGVVINVTEDKGVTPPAPGSPQTFDLFLENGGTFTLPESANVTLNQPASKFITWSYLPGGSLQRELTPGAPGKLIAEAAQDITAQENLSLIVKNNTALMLDLISQANSKSNITNAINRLTSNDIAAISTTPNLHKNVTQIAAKRANGLARRAAFFSKRFTENNSNISGVAAGSGASGDFSIISNPGAWTTPFLGSTTQRAKGNNPGYRGKYYGTSLGFDSVFNDNTMAGLAFSYVKSTIKHQGLNLGDINNFKTYVNTLYGTYEPRDNWFIQGVASFSRNKVKNKEIRTESTGDSIAEAKYNSDSWGGEFLVGYDFNLEGLATITPTIGFEYNRTNKVKYTETGTINQNLTVTRKAINRFEAVLGAGYNNAIVLDNQLTLMPEIHGNIRYNVNNKPLKIEITQNNGSLNNLLPRTNKPTKFVGNIGGGISVKTAGMMEYGVDYDIRLASKYIAHQGSVKLRVNF